MRPRISRAHGVITVAAFSGMLTTASCVSLGGLTAEEPADASTTDAMVAPMDVPDASTNVPNDAEGAGDVAEAAPAPTFQRVFVTAIRTPGNLGGLTGADSRCNASAKSSGVPGVYKAILSDPSGNAKDRLAFRLPIRVVSFDGSSALVASNAAELWDGMLSAAINRDEKGLMVPPDAVWTGTNVDGALPGDAHCTFWATGSANASAWAGNAAATNKDWTISEWGPQMYTSLSCDSLARLYCLEQ